MKTSARVLATVILYVLLISPAQAKVVWHWEDDFTAEEQSMLTKWIGLTIAGIEKRVAAFPFDVHIFFHRRSAGEPVPWAQTERSTIQGVHFFVDTRYPIEDFLADWTGPHELSHLLIPYVGRSRSWFAEGFGSYMQYQIMEEMGVLTHKQVNEHYRSHIGKAARNYSMSHLPFTEAAPKLRGRREYATMYWGGAVYFLQVDHELRKHESSMINVLTKFVTCCRNNKYRFRELISEFDRLSDSKTFSQQLELLESKPGFPPRENLFD